MAVQTEEPVLVALQAEGAFPQKGAPPQLRRPGTFLALDAWRGFASLWVTMYHMALVIVDRYPHLQSNPIYAFSLQGGLGVQLFFVISGYCIVNAAAVTHNRQGTFAQFMSARFRRVYPACWCALVLTGILSMLAEGLASGGFIGASTMADKHLLRQGPAFYFANITLSQGLLHQQSLIVQTWTLCYELAFYLLVGLALAGATRRFGERGMLTSIHLVTVVALVFLVLPPHSLRYPFDLWPQFGLGVLVYDLVRHKENGSARIWGAVITALFVVYIVRQNDLVGLMPGSSRRQFAVTLGFALLLLLSHRSDERISRTRIFRGFAWIGAFSYSLYLTHTLSIGVVNQAYKLLRLPEGFHGVAFTLVIMAAMAFGLLFYRFCEQPFMRKKQPARAT
jgi:exopolysaccharide production protein ExoZ